MCLYVKVKRAWWNDHTKVYLVWRNHRHHKRLKNVLLKNIEASLKLQFVFGNVIILMDIKEIRIFIFGNLLIMFALNIIVTAYKRRTTSWYSIISRNNEWSRFYTLAWLSAAALCAPLNGSDNDFEVLALSCFGAALLTSQSSGEDTSSTFFQSESAIPLGDKKDKLLLLWVKKIQLKMGEAANDRWVQRRNKHIPVRWLGAENRRFGSISEKLRKHGSAL